MESLPFAHRQPRTRAVETERREEGVFPSIEQSRPQNTQMFPYRTMADGQRRPISMKISARVVDSRMDQVIRNKQNMFFDKSNPNPERVLTPAPLEGKRKHSATPYDYSTEWIDHPPSNSSLAPTCQAGSTYLKSPCAGEDKARQKAHEKSLFEEINLTSNKVQAYVDRSDEEIKSSDHRHLEGIRTQRENHLKALEARRRIEKIRYFDSK